MDQGDAAWHRPQVKWDRGILHQVLSTMDRAGAWIIPAAQKFKLPITVCHPPPGTSKWNKIEHRLFSFISMNWRGTPLRTWRTVAQLIAATRTDSGLTLRAELDENKYPKGVKIF